MVTIGPVLSVPSRAVPQCVLSSPARRTPTVSGYLAADGSVRPGWPEKKSCTQPPLSASLHHAVPPRPTHRKVIVDVQLDYPPYPIGGANMTGHPGGPSTDTLTAVAVPLVELVHRARRGDAAAWGDLVSGLQGVAWRATADLGLHSEDRQDVFAATFFRLYERLETIREPEKLPGWVATTARNECRQMMRTRRRTELRDEFESTETADGGDLADGLLDGELRTALRMAFQRLGLPCQELLRLATAVPSISYDQIAEITGISRNSLGPTRQRCLQRLRQTPELQPFLEGAGS